jgi:thymidylate synthase
MPWTQTVNELKWFISGSSNYKDLPKNTQHWWHHWADSDGELGPIYGKLLRNHNGVDQLSDFIDGLREDPYSRRHVISLWGPAEMRDANLPCCHGLVIQGFLSSDDELSIQMYQRSADFFVGEAVNVASYALFTYLVAAAIWAVPKRLTIVIGDAHIYDNHVNQVQEYLERPYVPAPKLKIDGRLKGMGLDTLLDFTMDDLMLEGYEPLPPIQAPLAI